MRKKALSKCFWDNLQSTVLTEIQKSDTWTKINLCFDMYKKMNLTTERKLIVVNDNNRLMMHCFLGLTLLNILNWHGVLSRCVLPNSRGFLASCEDELVQGTKWHLIRSTAPFGKDVRTQLALQVPNRSSALKCLFKLSLFFSVLQSFYCMVHIHLADSQKPKNLKSFSHKKMERVKYSKAFRDQ